PKIYYDPGTKVPNSVSFIVHDGTGTIRVSAFRFVAKKMIRQNLLPRVDDEVEVSGPLAIQKDREPRIFLQTLRHYHIKRLPIPKISLGELAFFNGKNKTLRVEGVVAHIYKPRNPKKRAPYKLVLWDGTGKGYLVIWPDAYKNLVQRLGELLGKPLSAIVTLSSYKGKIQLKVSSSQDIDLAKDWEHSFLTLDKLDSRHLGKLVFIMGEVYSFEPEKGKLVLKKDNIKVSCYILDPFSKGSSFHLYPGELILLRGLLERRKQEMVLLVVSSRDIFKLKNRPLGRESLTASHESSPHESQNENKEEKRKFEDISTMPLGSQFWIEARIKKILFPKKNRYGNMMPAKIILQSQNKDKKIEIPLIIWNRDFRAIKSFHPLKEGYLVRAFVKLDEYRGRKQLYLLQKKFSIIQEKRETQNRNEGQKEVSSSSSYHSSKEFQASTLKDIQEAPLQSEWKVEALILKVYPPKKGRSGRMMPAKILLKDDKIVIPLILWERDYKNYKDILQKGVRIQGDLRIGKYRGKRQLYLQKGGTLQKLKEGAGKIKKEPKAPSKAEKTTKTTKIEESKGKEKPGKVASKESLFQKAISMPEKSEIQIEAWVLKIFPPSPGRRGKMRPAKILLKEGNTVLPLVIWEKEYNRIQSSQPIHKGDKIRGILRTGRYKGRFQFYLPKNGRLEVLSSSSNQNSPNEKKPLKSEILIKPFNLREVGSHLLGQTLFVEGEITQYFQDGKYILAELEDLKGRVKVRIPSSIFPKISNFQIGGILKVKGIFRKSDDYFYIDPSDVPTCSLPSLPVIMASSLSQIRPEPQTIQKALKGKVGHVFTIMGELVSSKLEKGIYQWEIQDHTGKIQLRIPKEKFSPFAKRFFKGRPTLVVQVVRQNKGFQIVEKSKVLVIER
ncbi:MAG: hypothetical protein D6785_00790, partial [Planctomycetota bacterium]